MAGTSSSGDSSLRWIALFTGLAFLAGLGMLAGTAYIVIDTRRDIATAATADGVVVDLIGSRDSDGDTLYYPQVRFVTGAGAPVEFTGSVGSSPAAFDVGEHVTVFYDPADPSDVRIDSFLQLWFGPLILGIFGTVFTLVGGVVTVVLLRAGRGSPKRPAVPSLTEPVAVSRKSTVERTPRD